MRAVDDVLEVFDSVVLFLQLELRFLRHVLESEVNLFFKVFLLVAENIILNILELNDLPQLMQYASVLLAQLAAVPVLVFHVGLHGRHTLPPL